MPNEKKFGTPPVWPLNISYAYPGEINDGIVHVQSLKSITTREARKLGASSFSPMMGFHSYFKYMPSGISESEGIPVSFMGGNWRAAVPWYNNMLFEKDWVNALCSLALTMRYEWSVWIGYEVGPRMRFISDPSGAREAFRLRDIPPGRARRIALRNWVEGHWRSKRNSEEDSSWVKKHLRGATNFNWNGLRCRIQPPDFVDNFPLGMRFDDNT